LADEVDDSPHKTGSIWRTAASAS